MSEICMYERGGQDKINRYAEKIAKCIELAQFDRGEEERNLYRALGAADLARRIVIKENPKSSDLINNQFNEAKKKAKRRIHLMEFVQKRFDGSYNERIRMYAQIIHECTVLIDDHMEEVHSGHPENMPEK